VGPLYRRKVRCLRFPKRFPPPHCCLRLRRRYRAPQPSALIGAEPDSVTATPLCPRKQTIRRLGRDVRSVPQADMQFMISFQIVDIRFVNRGSKL
jgi:hypothetical protein